VPEPAAALPAHWPGEPLANLPVTMPGVAPTETDERRERELDDILREIGTDTRIRVYHVMDGRAMFAGEMGGEEFTLDLLMDLYGGGDKTLKIYQGREHKETVKVPLDPTIPARSPRQARIEAEKRLSAGPGGGLGDVASLVTAMGTAQISQVNMMQTMMQAQQRQAADMAQQSQQMMTGLITAMTAMFAATKGERGPDPIEMVAKVAEIMRPKETPSITDAMSVFEKGLSIGQRVAGGGDNDSVMPMVTEGMRTLGNLVEGIVATKKAEAARIAGGGPVDGEPPRRLPAVVAPAPLVSTEPAPPAVVGTITPNGGAVTNPNDRPWVAFARAAGIEMLFKFAHVLTPAAAADTITARLPDSEYDDLMADIFDQTAPGFGGRLVDYFGPVVVSLPAEWLGGVIQLIVESSDPEEGAGDDAGDTDATPAAHGGNANPSGVRT
jgi:hypothetical protein